MFRYLFELISALFIFGLARAVVSMVARALNSGSSPNSAPREPAANSAAAEMRTAGELRKDPVCGTFVAVTTPYSLINEGNTTYFCSKECRDRFKTEPNMRNPWRKSTAARS